MSSKTTLLGLLKHVTYEGVRFDQAITGRQSAEIGISSTPDRSFTMAKTDSIASICAAHAHRCEESPLTMARLALDDIIVGRGERT